MQRRSETRRTEQHSVRANWEAQCQCARAVVAAERGHKAVIESSANCESSNNFRPLRAATCSTHEVEAHPALTTEWSWSTSRRTIGMSLREGARHC